MWSPTPAQIDGLEYAYLAGAPGPQTETRAGFEVDGVEVKVRLGLRRRLRRLARLVFQRGAVTMTDTATLQADLEALKAARRKGERRVSIEGFSVEYASDAEMRAAIAALESEIAAAQGSPPIRNVYPRSTGWS